MTRQLIWIQALGKVPPRTPPSNAVSILDAQSHCIDEHKACVGCSFNHFSRSLSILKRPSGTARLIPSSPFRARITRPHRKIHPMNLAMATSSPSALDILPSATMERREHFCVRCGLAPSMPRRASPTNRRRPRSRTGGTRNAWTPKTLLAIFARRRTTERPLLGIPVARRLPATLALGDSVRQSSRHRSNVLEPSEKALLACGRRSPMSTLAPKIASRWTHLRCASLQRSNLLLNSSTSPCEDFPSSIHFRGRVDVLEMRASFIANKA